MTDWRTTTRGSDSTNHPGRLSPSALTITDREIQKEKYRQVGDRSDRPSPAIRKSPFNEKGISYN